MVAGVPMMNGCRALEGYTADTDATIVTRILDAGGTISGKSTNENLCFSGSSFTTGKGPVLNPHDPTRSAGGSSSGSAVLVATGEVDMAIGGDQGGSIRLPAAWSGIVGLKPTFGLVPYTGAMGLDGSIDHLGPMAKTVQDCALLLEVIAGYDNGLDPRQPTNIAVPEYSKEIQVDRLDGIKVGLLKEGFGFPESDPRVDEAVRNAVRKLESVGAEVVDVSIPLHYESGSIWSAVGFTGSSNIILDGAGFGSGYNGFYPTSLITTAGMAFRSQTNDFDPSIKASIMLGDYMQSHYYGKYYAKAQNLRRLLRDAYDQTFDKCDVIAMPTIPFLPTKLPKDGCSIKDYLGLLATVNLNTKCADATLHPSISLNAGFLNNLPVGIQLTAGMFQETVLLKVAHVIEKQIIASNGPTC
ncbi:amidase-like isoform X3 [Amphiura filiformis]